MTSLTLGAGDRIAKSGSRTLSTLAMGAKRAHPAAVEGPMPQTPYVAYLYASRGAAPHMEIVAADDLPAAKAQTRRLLAEHDSATFAEVWQDERQLSTLFGARKTADAE